MCFMNPNRGKKEETIEEKSHGNLLDCSSSLQYLDISAIITKWHLNEHILAQLFKSFSLSEPLSWRNLSARFKLKSLLFSQRATQANT